MKNMKKRHKAVMVSIALVWAVTLDGRTVSAADGIETTGDALQFVLAASAGVLALGYRDGRGGLQLGESLAVTLGVTYALKFGVHELRPNGGGHSFPSGHTSVSFSAAEFMRRRYGWKYGVPAYAAASFVAYSRVESRQHHPKDVVAGAGIGMLSSYIFTKPYKGWSVSVGGDTKSFGLRLSRQF